MNPNTVNAASAKRSKAVLVLQPSELALDSRAATVETLPLVRPVGDRGQRDRAALAKADNRDDARSRVSSITRLLS
jgi:hypothetical protein